MSLPVSYCLRCGYKFEDASTLEDKDEKPGPGSLSVCIKCGAVAKFGDDLTVVPLTADEADRLRADSDTMAYLSRIVKAVHIVQHLRKRRN